MIEKELGHYIGSYYIAPVIFSYSKWVLDNALEKNITSLYFLARDGYLMCKCAEIICKKEKKYKNIKCIYFYCSRVALRLASYCMIPFDEVIESLFLNGYNLSLNKLFDRALLNDDEKKNITEEIQAYDLNKVLSISESVLYKNKLKGSQKLQEYIVNKSKEVYENTILYIKQSGMMDKKKFAIVDSGWVGTIQKSLFTLLESAGFDKKLIGFYFGMYAFKRNTETMEYNTFYFNGKKDILRKSSFNNNIFELICSANEGMTLSYKLEQGKAVAVLAPYKLSNPKIWIQEGAVKNIKVLGLKDIEKLLKKLMLYPNKKEADYIGTLNFTDDLSENSMYELAPVITGRQCKNLLVPLRIYKNKNKDKYDELRLYWPEGSVVRSDVKTKRFYLYNIYIWNILRFIIKTYGNGD